MPYYLVQENVFHEKDLHSEQTLEGFDENFLGSSEINTLLLYPETGLQKEQVDKWLKDGCRCFGIKHEGDIAAYMWCSVGKCHIDFFPMSFREDDAYLFSAYSFPKYRGRNLAPYLRYRLYERLRAIGCHNFYSVTELFNTPALRFKEKLKVKNLQLGLSIKIAEKYHWNTIVKDYQKVGL